MATHIPDKMLLPKKKALTADSDGRMPKWEYPYTSNPTHNRPSSPARVALRCCRFRMLTLELIKTTMLPRKATDRQILPDRKSTRLNSSHVRISYAVFCLKKKKCSRKGNIPAAGDQCVFRLSSATASHSAR